MVGDFLLLFQEIGHVLLFSLSYSFSCTLIVMFIIFPCVTVCTVLIFPDDLPFELSLIEPLFYDTIETTCDHILSNVCLSVVVVMMFLCISKCYP